MTARGRNAADAAGGTERQPGDAGRLTDTIATLRESERRLRLVIDNAPVAIARINAGLCYTFVNRHLAWRVGRDADDIVGQRLCDVITPQAFASVEPYVRRCLAGEAIEAEIEVDEPAGRRFVQIRFAPEWREGRVVAFVSATTDLTHIKNTEAALRESEAAYRAMFEVSSVGQVEFDPETGRFLRANSAMCRFLDYSEAELLARSMFDVTHPDERAHTRELMLHLMVELCPAIDVEKRYVRKDGSTVWARTTVNAVRDRARRALRNTSAVLDITDRKRHEEKEHLLMREVNHRAKNMLSVVQSIAQQTATGNPHDFLERLSARIRALAASQDLLIRNEWQGVDVRDLVRAQLQRFAPLIGSRITVQGPKLRLAAASSQAIGLALEELATNAGQYGALSTDAGNVDVAWGVDGDTFGMTWTERHGPAVQAPQRRGFGTVLIATMAERSVGGAVDLDYPPSGVRWRLTCPVENVRDRPEAADFSDWVY